MMSCYELSSLEYVHNLPIILYEPDVLPHTQLKLKVVKIKSFISYYNTILVCERNKRTTLKGIQINNNFELYSFSVKDISTMNKDFVVLDGTYHTDILCELKQKKFLNKQPIEELLYRYHIMKAKLKPKVFDPQCFENPKQAISEFHRLYPMLQMAEWVQSILDIGYNNY